MSKSAIYAIEMNNAIYIGETTDVEKRWQGHKIEQERAFKLAGVKERPTFKILSKLNKNLNQTQRRKIEQKWINHFKQFKDIVNVPTKPTQETRDKMSKAKKGKYVGKLNWNYKGERIKIRNIKTGKILDTKGICNVAKKLKTSTSNIRGLLDGKHKYIKGYELARNTK